MIIMTFIFLAIFPLQISTKSLPITSGHISLTNIVEYCLYISRHISLTNIADGDFDSFMSNVPNRVLIILDEAYYEYAQQINDYPDSM